MQILHLSKQNRLSVPYSIHQYSMKPGHHKSPQNQTSSINPKSHTRHHGTNGHYTHVQQLPADVAKGLWHLQGLHQHHASAVFPWCWVQVGCTRRGKTSANVLLSAKSQVQCTEIVYIRSTPFRPKMNQCELANLALQDAFPGTHGDLR